MRGIKRQRQMHRTARRCDVARKTLVIFDVACGQIVRMFAFEFTEQFLWRLAQNVHQHIQTPTMRHANNNFLHTFFTGALNRFIHRGDEAFAAFQ